MVNDESVKRALDARLSALTADGRASGMWR